MNMETNKTYNENCLETMSRMPNGFVDLTVTSPPYDDLREYKGYVFDFEAIAKELFRVTKPGGIVVWVVGDATIDGSETGTSFKQALFFKECGFRLHDTMIYQKNNYSLPIQNRYFQVFEYMFVFSKGPPTTHNLIRVPTQYRDKNNSCHTSRDKNGVTKKHKYESGKDSRNRGNVWKYNVGYMRSSRDTISYKHPATFPEALARDHIISWSNECDLVYDPFIGSGTTAKMARDYGRLYIGSEISSEYCEIIAKRLSQQQLF